MIIDLISQAASIIEARSKDPVVAARKQARFIKKMKRWVSRGKISQEEYDSIISELFKK